MQVRSMIVLAVDGLRASSLGAYGNTWFPTPAVDSLASESLLFDQCLVEDASLDATYAALFGKEHGVAELIRNRSTLLVTDAPSAREFAGVSDFDRVALTPLDEQPAKAESPTETRSAQTLALLLDQLEQTSRADPVFAWTHLRFAAGPWDAPWRLAEALLEEDDPEPDDDVRPPLADCTEEDDDRVFLATVRYAAQVVSLDACVRVLPGALDDILGAGQYVLAIAGLRGFALGEHGRIGLDVERPYNESRHVPLMIRDPERSTPSRTARLTRLSDLPSLLLGENASGEAVRFTSPNGPAYQDQLWKLYLPMHGDAELYSKPDDRWEMNDVAARHHHVVEQLEILLNA